MKEEERKAEKGEIRLKEEEQQHAKKFPLI